MAASIFRLIVPVPDMERADGNPLCFVDRATSLGSREGTPA